MSGLKHNKYYLIRFFGILFSIDQPNYFGRFGWRANIILFVLNSKLILDLDECQSSPCQTNMDCQNTLGSFICSCKAGFDSNGFVTRETYTMSAGGVSGSSGEEVADTSEEEVYMCIGRMISNRLMIIMKLISVLIVLILYSPVF